MARFVVAAVVVAALAAGAAATNPACHCTQGISCARSLEACATQNYTSVFPGESWNTQCGSNPYYTCGEKPFNCLTTYGCGTPPPLCQCRHDIKCYRTLTDCETYQGALTPESGKNTDCLELDRPIYACWEEPDVCRRSSDCTYIPPGGGNQDPHFQGFDGSKYYFEGAAGQDYNIVSDTTVQLNAHFIRLNQLKGTYMGRIGIRFGESSVTFDPHFGAFFNNTLMTAGEVETPEGSFLIETLEGGRLRFAFQNDVFHFAVNTAVEKGVREEAYLNIKAALIGTPSRPHGILGQTARVAIPGADPLPSPFVIEGTEEDYHVRDGLLGTSFTYNRFVGEEQPITASGSRFRRSTTPALFEAAAN